MLGGRVAEQAVFGEVTNGAESDLAHATELARKMVCRWGMSTEIGPMAQRRGDEPVFLGREMAQSPDYSDATAKVVDDEVKRLITDVETHARKLMDDHRGTLDRLAEALLKAETLSREQIEGLLGERSAAPADVGKRPAASEFSRRQTRGCCGAAHRSCRCSPVAGPRRRPVA